MVAGIQDRSWEWTQVSNIVVNTTKDIQANHLGMGSGFV